MAEKIKFSQEQHEHKQPHRVHHEISKDAHEKESRSRHEHAENIEQIRSKAEIESDNSEKYTEKILDQPEHKDSRPMYVNRELKEMAYLRTLNRTRQNMNLPAKTFSKLIHNPVIDAVSEVAAKTIARPSGVLAGGVTAFLGSSLFLWVSRHYGYEYNFLLFALLFVGGFFFGLLAELLLRMVRKTNIS